MELAEETKDLVRLALDSHQSCVHDARLCHLLIMCEIGFRRHHGVQDDGEIEAISRYLTDCVLSDLMLKDMVEPVGLTEDGEFLIGLTQRGWDEVQ